MIYSINFTIRGAIAIEANSSDEAYKQAKEELAIVGCGEFTNLYPNIHEFSPGLIDLHEIYDDEGQEVES